MTNWPTHQSHPALAPGIFTQGPNMHHGIPQPKPNVSSNPIAPPRLEDYNCARCTRPGHLQDSCKSMNKACRQCGVLGHFNEVHDVIDDRYRQVIIQVLGINLWEESRPEAGFHLSGSGDPYEPEMKRARNDPGFGNRRIPLEKLAEMEQRSTAGRDERSHWGRADHY